MAKEQRRYFASIWNWLRDGENRKVIAWIGSGLMVAIGALLYQTTRPETEHGAAPPSSSNSVTVGEGLGVGGNARVDGDLNINTGPRDDE